AAVAAALADAIKDGALQGLSAGARALISKGGDIEAQLAKALTFEGVFTALEEALDPAGAALRQLESEFTALKAIFDEAGASTEERAKLEQLYQIKRAELTKQEAEQTQDLSRLRELEIELLVAQGKEVEALAASRKLELEGMTEAERVIKQQ